MIEPGAVVAEKYQIERVLGRGGMGVVFAALHLHLGQRVALKFLRPEAARDDELVARFLREARAAVRLRGEHVGKVVDVGTLGDGTPFIVMEYLEGHDLASELGRSGRLPVAITVDHVLQACVGLAEAHAAGIVHRDLKPANLFLTQRPDGTPLVKVMDFGIAKAAGRIDGALTDSAAVMGSPGYMSPEQLRSARDVDARADIWSLGVVLYELTSGRRPYEATTITELAMRVATEPVPPLPPGLPRGFAAVVMRCLEKDADRRFADVAALAAALAPHGTAGAAALAIAVARVQAGAPPMPSADGLDVLMNATTLSRATSARAVAVEAAGSPLRRWWPVVALAAATTAAIAVVVLVTTGGAPSAESVDASAAPAAVTPIPVDAGPDDATAALATSPPDAGPTPAIGSGSAARDHRGGRPRPGAGSGSGSVTATVPATVPASGSGAGSAPVTGAPPGAGTGSAPHIRGDTNGDGIPDVR